MTDEAVDCLLHPAHDISLASIRLFYTSCPSSLGHPAPHRCRQVCPLHVNVPNQLAVLAVPQLPSLQALSQLAEGIRRMVQVGGSTLYFLSDLLEFSIQFYQGHESLAQGLIKEGKRDSVCQ